MCNWFCSHPPVTISSIVHLLRHIFFSTKSWQSFPENMDIEKLYDEFGNYIGPDRSDDEHSDDDSLQLPEEGVAQPQPDDEPPPAPGVDRKQQHHQGGEQDGTESVLRQPTEDFSSVVDAGLSSRNASDMMIVQAEDKQLYPRAEDVFGSGTEVLVEEEDMQPLSEPLVATTEERTSGIYEHDKSIPNSIYDRKFLMNAILPFPSLNRNVALVGHIHHGKTSIVDMLFDGTHHMPWPSSHEDDRKFPIRYSDVRHDEQRLGISIKSTMATLLLNGSRGKSYGITVIDTPGHMNFTDETAAAMLLVDGIIIVVDVAEGVMMGTRTVLRKAAQMGLSIVLVISKIDRLCLELRLPPTDAYHKIQHIIDACNEIITTFPNSTPLSPTTGNVAFSSASERVCFTLPQFARAYIRANGGQKKFPLSDKQLARRFWGNIYYDSNTRKFSERSSAGLMGMERTFVSFILEPYYKLHTAVVSKDVDELAEFLRHNDLMNDPKKKKNHHKYATTGTVKKSALQANLKAMLKAVNSNCFGMGDLSGLADMLVDHIPSPIDSGHRIMRTLCKPSIGFERNEYDTRLIENCRTAMAQCDTEHDTPVVAYVSKLLPDERGMRFDCIVRVLSGVLHVGDVVTVLGHNGNENDSGGGGGMLQYGETDDDDIISEVIDALFIPCARFKLPTKQAVAGQIILVRGIDRTINKSATILKISEQQLQQDDETESIRKRKGRKKTNMIHTKKLSSSILSSLALRNVMEFVPPAVVKVAIEPIKPSELPKMVASLRMCSNSYPGVITKVEETGEHVVIGTGEMYLDCVLRDLREAFGNVEVKVSDPVVPFTETVTEISALQCTADILSGINNDDENEQNGNNGRLVMVAEPLEETVLNAVETRQLEPHFDDNDNDDNDDKNNNNKTKDEEGDGGIENRRTKLRLLGWDALAAKSLWTFGPDQWAGPNALVNDILVSEEREIAVTDMKDSIVQGFCWAMREGPLSDEPIRGVKIRVLQAKPSSSSSSSSNQAMIIPSTRRVVFSSILTASPRMMEPINEIEILCPAEAAKITSTLVSRRRGVIVAKDNLAGTPLTKYNIHMPVLDSFGFEPDIRTLTHGAAFCTQQFHHWAIVPGDPLDKSIVLRPLEAAARHELAREVMIKTRRRKGLGDEVNLTKYMDDPLFAELAADHEDLKLLL